MSSPYDELPRNQANYAPLTPLTFIERAAYVYPNKLSVVHGTERWTWKQTYARCRRLASALARRGVGKNDTVAIMAPNTPPMYEAAFGVPMCGAVLNTLNTRAGCASPGVPVAARRGEGVDHRSGVLGGD